MSRGSSFFQAEPGVRAAPKWMPDTRFGAWFQRSEIWKRYVVEYALDDFERLFGDRQRKFATTLDAGCGAGQAFDGIARRFGPQRIVAIDIDPQMLPPARANAARCACPVDVQQGDLAQLALADASFDLVLCHQALHHAEDQQAVLRSLFRVLRPGGALFLSESCRPFTTSPQIRLLFRHRMETQRSAASYLDLLRTTGFAFGVGDVANPDPFWSRRDFGLFERLGVPRRPPREPSEVLVIARRP
jgi:SAM-dependent methyltransferase